MGLSMETNRLAVDLDHILDHTREAWNDLRGERLFITGGTGFFGCWLLESFAWANDRLGLNATARVLTRNPDAFRRKAPHLADHPAITFEIGDVRSFDFPAGSFSHVIHAATDPSEGLIDVQPLTVFNAILEGAQHTLDFSHQCGTRKFLMTSSGAVYGRQPADMTHIPEGYMGAPDPTDPHSAFGGGKRAAETLCTLYAKQYGIETKIARCFAFVGPYLRLDVQYAIGNFIRDGLNGGPIIVKSDGTPCRSYLYAADLAIWLWTILFRGELCHPYNVGSEQSISIADLAGKVAAHFVPAREVKILGTPDPERPAERYVPATKRARNELQLFQFIDLDEAIRRTVSWMNG
jgi:nucleoside-diphosphate-sugar epimerase